MNTQKTEKGLYSFEVKQVELQGLVDHTRKFVNGIESDLSSGGGSAATFLEMERSLREMADMAVSATESLERRRLLEESEDEDESPVEVTREAAREMIAKLFDEKGQLDYIEIMTTLDLDPELIIDICNELEAEGKIEGVD